MRLSSRPQQLDKWGSRFGSPFVLIDQREWPTCPANGRTSCGRWLPCLMSSPSCGLHSLPKELSSPQPTTNLRWAIDAARVFHLYNTFIACFITEYETCAWWSKRLISMWEGAPIGWMNFSHEWCEEVTRALRLADKPIPAFRDCFFLMGQLQDAFKEYYE